MLKIFALGLTSLFLLLGGVAHGGDLRYSPSFDLIAEGNWSDPTGVQGRSLAIPALVVEGQSGWTLEAQGWWLAGDELTPHLGDAQSASNVDSPPMIRFGEIFASVPLGNNRIYLGRMDANSHAQVLPHSGEFLHSSLGFSPSSGAFPSYPAPTAGIVVEHIRRDRGFRAGLFESKVVADGAGLSLEFAAPYFFVEGVAKGEKGRVGLGIWAYEAEDGESDLGLWIKGEVHPRPGLHLLALGGTNPSFLIPKHLSVAARLEQGGGSSGLAFHWASLRGSDDELAIELHHRRSFLEGRLSLVPAILQIMNSGGGEDPETVFLLRTELSLY